MYTFLGGNDSSRCVYFTTGAVQYTDVISQPAADADKAPLLSRPEREELFRRCSTHKTVSPYPLGWFLQPEIKRENVIEWLLWALFSSRREEAPEEWNEELDQYVDRLEEMLDTKFEEGRNDKVQSMRLPFDPVLMVHRPLFWYTVSASKASSDISCLSYSVGVLC